MSSEQFNDYIQYFQQEPDSNKEKFNEQELKLYPTFNQGVSYFQYYSYYEKLVNDQEFHKLLSKSNEVLYEMSQKVKDNTELTDYVNQLVKTLESTLYKINVLTTKNLTESKVIQKFESYRLIEYDQIDPQLKQNDRQLVFNFQIDYPEQLESNQQLTLDDFEKHIVTLNCKISQKLRESDKDEISAFCNIASHKLSNLFYCQQDEQLIVQMTIDIFRDNIIFLFYKSFDQCILLLFMCSDYQRFVAKGNKTKGRSISNPVEKINQLREQLKEIEESWNKNILHKEDPKPK